MLKCYHALYYTVTQLHLSVHWLHCTYLRPLIGQLIKPLAVRFEDDQSTRVTNLQADVKVQTITIMNPFESECYQR